MIDQEYAVTFSEKFLFGPKGKLFHNERVQEVHENYINGFSEKVLQGKWTIFGLKLMHGHNSGFTLRIFKKFCTIKEVKKPPSFKAIETRHDALW